MEEEEFQEVQSVYLYAITFFQTPNEFLSGAFAGLTRLSFFLWVHKNVLRAGHQQQVSMRMPGT